MIPGPTDTFQRLPPVTFCTSVFGRQEAYGRGYPALHARLPANDSNHLVWIYMVRDQPMLEY